uniref:Orc1-like AAA ATPase domain-containing protein n=1 Tax=Skeletonema marinoi TaxID=267567 RepID=A0A7S2L2X7_9STRA
MNSPPPPTPYPAMKSSTQPAATATSCRQTAMKKWIVGAIRSLREKRNNGHRGGATQNKIICSSEYMSCAFIIAHSLADQLSAIEEQRSYPTGSGEIVPQPNRNEPWSNYIYINCGLRITGRDEAAINGGKVGALYGGFDAVPRTEDTGELNILAEQLSMLDSDSQPIEYLNIQGAVLNIQVKGKSSLVIYDGKWDIYSLGEVFYELFSGGQHNVPEKGMPRHHSSSQSLPIEQSSASTRRKERKSNRSMSIPVDYGTTDKHELKSAMELIDELGEDDELFGNTFNSESKIDEDLKDDMSDIEQQSEKDLLQTAQPTRRKSDRSIDELALGRDDELFGNAFNRENKIDEDLKVMSDTEQQSGDKELPQTARPTRRKSESYAIGGPLQKSFRSASPESRTVEPLRSLALPTALCNLISNMIESTNPGSNTRDVDDDTYKSMTDVRDDLKMMMDTPDLYLRDIDIIHASNVGLQFEGIGDREGHTPLCGREAELETLKESYHRSILGESEVAMICGSSGIGKSKLSQEFAEYVTTRSSHVGGCVFLSGRFDKVQQAQPFQAISSAFDKYCLWLSSRDQITVEKISSALSADLKDDVTSLVALMPNLARIIGKDCDGEKDDEKDESAVDAQKRLRYLICQFVEITSRCHEEPLILFLDDCQWIDAASVALLNQILVMSGASTKDNRFFFYCCCRDDEMNESHQLSLMLSSIADFGIKTNKILLTSMSEDTVNKMVSAMLSLLPRLTRPLASIIHEKTKGSPLFIKQLMVELNKQRMLHPSLTRRRWVWKSDKIRDMEVPENVDMFINKSFNQLSSEVLSALSVLSCFGSSADVHLVQRLETEIRQSLVEQLDTAVAANVLGKRNGKFYFLHDKLQEAAYSVIKSDVRCLEHFRYGLALSNVAVREKDDKLLIIAVGQINHGGPRAVADGEQGVTVAKMNLDVGKKVMKMSDLVSAYSFFDSGISYLRKGHWDYHYDMTLELFNLAVKCAFTNGEYGSVKILTGQIIRYAKCFEDKCQAISFSITLLSWSVNVPEAIKVLMNTLKSLGVEFPTAITRPFVQGYLKSTRVKLAELSDESLLSYPLMVDRSKIMAMELLVKLHENLTFSGDTTSLPVIPLKMIQISLKHGMTPLSPIGFAQYGNYLALVREEFEEGYRYVKFALSLMKQIPSRAHDGDVIYYSTHTKLAVEPMQNAVENYLEAYKAAMKSGATKYAIASCYLYDTFSFWSGKRLDIVVESMKATMKQMRYHKNMLTRTLLLPTLRVAVRLMGRNNTSQSDLNDIFDENCEEEDVTGKITSVSAVAAIVKLHESLVFREFDKAKICVEKMFKTQSLSGFNMSAPMFHRIFYSGLVSFWVGREMDDQEWIARGVECKNAIKKMVESASSWNFQNKTYLLQAEEQFCDRNFEEAERLYNAAILSSKEHAFVNEEALANELAGHFYIETGRRNKSFHYFLQAMEKYNEWGAFAKARTMGKYLEGSEHFFMSSNPPLAEIV